MKHLGSETFGTTTIKTDEYILLAQIAVENGASIDQAALDIEAIDDMLGLQKIESLLLTHRFTKSGRIRKNSSFLDIIDKRIDKLIEDSKQLKK